jgi:hypothetical protein
MSVLQALGPLQHSPSGASGAQGQVSFDCYFLVCFVGPAAWHGFKFQFFCFTR